ncbi:hypothetical protein Lalb_Chr13g0292431 [Lupinus albus]|uniref:Uncharacterized protein n=1 Tax=Lupinus albus TaxID=3870 RepID=A0A6A4PHN2_LUPAL|nr:hypothetical protein Lalb_Chr13g0292431 [Lupinus albus]
MTRMMMLRTEHCFLKSYLRRKILNYMFLLRVPHRIVRVVLSHETLPPNTHFGWALLMFIIYNNCCLSLGVVSEKVLPSVIRLT